MLKKPAWSRLNWDRQAKHAGPHEVGLVLREEVGGVWLRRSLQKDLPGAAGCWQKRERATAHRVLTPVRHLCRAHDSIDQGCVCIFRGENIQPNIFIDPWYPVGLPGVHSTGGMCVNHGWTSYPWKSCPEQRLQSCNKHRMGRKATFSFASFPPGIKYTYKKRSGRIRYWGWLCHSQDWHENIRLRHACPTCDDNLYTAYACMCMFWTKAKFLYFQHTEL